MLWMYQISNWQLCLLIVFLFTFFSLLGWFLTRRWVNSFKTHHNEVVGFFMGAVGMLYAVLLAMIAVASWNNYTATEALVSQEASLVGDMFRSLEGYPQSARDHLRRLLYDYATTVIETEWPALQKGEVDKRALLAVDNLFDEWQAFAPEDEAQKAMQAESLGRLNQFLNVRHHRIQTGVSGIMPVLWLVVVIGAALNVGLTYFLWIENRRLHQILTAALGMTFGLVVYLIAAMDHPLWGEVNVSPAPFHAVRASMDRRLNPVTPGQKRQMHLSQAGLSTQLLDASGSPADR